MKRILIILCLLCVLVPGVALAAPVEMEAEQAPLRYDRAKVLSVEVTEDSSLDPTMFQGMEEVEVKLLSGDRKGEVLTIKSPLMHQSAFKVEYHPGDQVIVFVNEDHPEQGFTIFDHYRMTWVYYLAVIFVAVVFFVGKKSGWKALFSMLSSVVMMLLMVPLVIKGHAPVKLAIVLALVNTVLTLLVIGGWTKKTVAAILGTMAGLLVAWLLVYWVGPRAYITGLSNESAPMLLYLPNPVDPKAVIYASMLLGSLGAVMDVTMSIASSVEEIHKADQYMTFARLYQAAMNVGQDIMGTMANTLVLAYFASALPLAILIFAYNANMPYFYNMDLFVTEIVRLLTGSIGLILTIPATCAVAALMYRRKGE